jgi:uncharacterized membrane protein
MPASLQAVFEFLFKYRPFVFAKGRLAFLTPWPAAAGAAVALLLAAPALLSYRKAGGKTRPFDRAALVGIRVLALLLLFVCLLRPTLLLSTVVPQQSFVGILVDDSKSLRIEDVGGPRSDFVTKVLADPKSPLRQALEARFKLRFFRFSQSSERFSRFEDLRFAGDSTDVAGALRHAQQELQGVPLAGIVLVSDGGDNAGGPLSETLLALRAGGVPVFTVGLGRERFSKDVEVVRVEAPDSVLVGGSLVAGVTLQARGLGHTRARLLVEDDGRVIHSQDVELPEGEAQNVRVHVTANQAGPRLLRFRVAPIEGEQVTQNNSEDVLVDVLDGRQKILHLEGEPRFEPNFLRRAVDADKNLQLVTLERTAKNKFLRLGVDDAEELQAGFPKTREELYRYKGLVLGSIEASFFSSDQLRMMSDFVSQRGGGLMMLGGPHAFAEGGYAGTPLADALPVLLEPPPREPAAEGPEALAARFVSLRVEPTPFGAAHAITQLAASEAQSVERWRGLPALSSVNDVRRVKPGAATLLLGKPESRGDTRVVLAQQRFGRGKALAFTVQDSWQWQMHASITVEDTTYENLWRQLLRFLVSGVPGTVVASVASDVVTPGSSVTLRAEVDDDTYLRVNNAQVAAIVKDPTGATRELPLEWTVEKDGEYRGTFVASAAGGYEVRVEARRAGKSLGQDVVHLRAQERSLEFHGAEMRATLLKRIAGETAGRAYTPETVAALPEDLGYTEGGASIVEQKDLWDMPALYLGILAALSAEWLYRKARGLA